MSKDNINDNKADWKKEYTIVLLLNIFYILVFYFIMILNN
ncbi:hypothetical protein HME9304_02931 [Flagellimonas maritima]|uniref:Uncharacterized protein n=1 Tax=Flagellimonas maritima TaxID=1383885 RepID=A0A2Z4LW23_9FLAO|nr:hypothetical protein HME9304_02931 [Allomuricauda aurantiaca]